jgi:chemotaxis protein histidine kinase CheA
MDSPEDPKTRAERELRQQVAALGQKFLHRTRDQAHSLRGLVARLREGDVSVLTQMQEISHKIHGSGAMFGFARISECAGHIEALCTSLTGAGAQADQAMDSDSLERFNGALEQLESAVKGALA